MRVSAIAAGCIAAAVVSPVAAAHVAYDPVSARVTAAEKKETLPLVKVVLAAHRAGRFSGLCAVYSRRVLPEIGVTRAGCRRVMGRVPRRPCVGCTYRVARAIGVYKTADDLRQRRKTIAWSIRVSGNSKVSGIEIRVAREHGRWALTEVLEEG